jgi:hypothetical protein
LRSLVLKKSTNAEFKKKNLLRLENITIGTI